MLDELGRRTAVEEAPDREGDAQVGHHGRPPVQRGAAHGDRRAARQGVLGGLARLAPDLGPQPLGQARWRSPGRVPGSRVGVRRAGAPGPRPDDRRARRRAHGPVTRSRGPGRAGSPVRTSGRPSARSVTDRPGETESMEPELVAAVEAALGTAVVAAARVHGGDVAIAFAVDLTDGRRVFVKTHRDPPPGFFSTEAAGLSWLAAADAVDVPEVLAVDDGRPSFLVLSWVERGAPVRDDRGRPRATARRPPRIRRAVLRAGGPADDRQPGPAQRARGDVGRVLRDVPAAPAGPSGRRRRCARPGDGRPARRRWPAVSARSVARPSRRRACTATCGRATGSSTPTGGAGSSTRPPTAVTASSTWR